MAITEKDYDTLLALFRLVHDRQEYAFVWLLRAVPGVRNVWVDGPHSAYHDKRIGNGVWIYVQVEEDFAEALRLLGETMREVHRRAAYYFVKRSVYDPKTMPNRIILDYPSFVITQAWALPAADDHEMHQLQDLAEDIGLDGTEILEFNEMLSRSPSQAFIALFERALRFVASIDGESSIDGE